MGRSIEIEEILTVRFHCDHCGKKIENNKKPIYTCITCGKEICKICKRHIHIEIGSGNGKHPFRWSLNHTNNYCPTCAEKKIIEAYELLGLALPKTAPKEGE